MSTRNYRISDATIDKFKRITGRSTGSVVGTIYEEVEEHLRNTPNLPPTGNKVFTFPNTEDSFTAGWQERGPDKIPGYSVDVFTSNSPDPREYEEATPFNEHDLEERRHDAWDDYDPMENV